MERLNDTKSRLLLGSVSRHAGHLEIIGFDTRFQECYLQRVESYLGSRCRFIRLYALLQERPAISQYYGLRGLPP